MFDFESVMKQAKDFQKQMKDDLQRMAIEGSAGGGKVKVVVNGAKELTHIEISEEAMGDRDLLADMILSALSSAYGEADREIESRVPSALGNMDLSSIMDMLKK